MQGQALPGFRDFYPEELALRNAIFTTWRDVARRYGFQEYDGPPLEPLELYTEKSGEEIVQQLYAFQDKGERQVALRPEMTPTLARMVGARAQALKKPIRWFSIPQLFRYERQQRGRLREHFQLNMDVIGEPGPAADAEVMAAALDIMRAFGLGPAAVPRARNGRSTGGPGRRAAARMCGPAQRDGFGRLRGRGLSDRAGSRLLHRAGIRAVRREKVLARDLRRGPVRRPHRADRRRRPPLRGVRYGRRRARRAVARAGACVRVVRSARRLLGRGEQGRRGAC